MWAWGFIDDLSITHAVSARGLAIVDLTVGPASSTGALDGGNSQDGGIRTVDLSPGKYTMSWQIINGDTIEISLQAVTTGWMCVGFNPNDLGASRPLRLCAYQTPLPLCA